MLTSPEYRFDVQEFLQEYSKLQCERDLSQLIAEVNDMTGDLHEKARASLQRQAEKERLLSVLNEKLNGSNPSAETTTKQKISDVIAKEVSI